MTQGKTHDGMKCPIDFDHHGAFHSAHWPEVYAKLRDECPRSWVDRYGGFWLSTKFSDILSISQRTDAISTVKTADPDTGEMRGGVTIPTMQGARSILNELDSPEWDAFRGFVTSRFSPKSAEKMRGRTADLAHALVDGFLERGHADLVEELTNPLPAMVTRRALVPSSRRAGTS
jgi:cytochrome P450